MNERFAALYAEPDFVATVRDHMIPSLLAVAELGDGPLHLVAGPGHAAASLRTVAPRLTIAQMDAGCAAEVASRFAADPDVDVVNVDATCLPFPDQRFSAATVVLSLLHLPTPDAQDTALRELARVLRPGASLVRLNAVDGPHFRRLAGDDTTVTPIDPLDFPARLEAAGFQAPHYDLWQFALPRPHATPINVRDRGSGGSGRRENHRVFEPSCLR
ncbi:MAG: methyltransferase domain-containing protein [Acidimicrobiia bacterium]|nr:methyltransferase domain-containing protein [Acidimicrobiia bacterium]